MKGKVVVITGASSGIGAELARLVAQEGGIPILLARSLDKLQRLASEIEGDKGVYQLDVSLTEQVYSVIKEIEDSYGKIDVLINNAGYGKFAEMVEASMEDYEDMMDVNYLGTVRCTKAVLPSMLKRRSGHIINIASVAGKIGSAKSTGYSATKFAVIGFSNSLRHELDETGVKVSVVNPGPIDTPFFETADPSGNYVKNVSWFMLSPQKVAKEILEVMKHRKKEITLPFLASIGVKLYHLFPRTFDLVMRKAMNKK